MQRARSLIRHRRLVWVAVVLLTIGLGVVATGIRFDFSPQAVYAQDDDLQAYTEAFREVFGYDDAVFLAVVEADDGGDVLTPPVLTWMRTVGDALARVPRVVAVASPATLRLPRFLLTGEPGLDLVSVLGDGPVTEADAQRLRAALDDFRLADRILVDVERKRAVLLVTADPDARPATVMRGVLRDVRAALSALPPPEGHRLRLSGLPVLRDDVVANLEADQTRMLPMAACVFFLVMWIAFRRAWGALLPLIAVGVGMVWTAGAFVLLDTPLNIIGNILPVLLYVIGTANSVHVLNRYVEESLHGSGNRDRALARTMSHMAQACFLTFFTTTIGFLSLTTARSEVLQTVGWQAGVGLALLYASTMLILGTLLLRIAPTRPSLLEPPRRRLHGALMVVGIRVTRHPGPVLAGGLLLCAVSLWLASGAVVNSSLMETYDDDHPMTEALHVVEASLGGVLSVDVSLQAEDADALVAPAAYEKIDALGRWARARPEVLWSRSHVDLCEAVRTHLPDGGGGDDGAAIRVADGVARQLAPVLHYERFFVRDAARARVMLRVRDVGTTDLLAFVEALQAEIARLSFEAQGIVPRLTGDGYVYARAMDGLIRDVLRSLLGAAAVIFAIIAVLFRSLRLGLISILPNLTPLVLTLGYMTLRGYELNTANVIVFAIGLGVAVDDTIHLLARYREELAGGAHERMAIRRALAGAGRAMVLTTLLMVLGLTFLSTSEFVPTRRFAELTSVTMVAALIGDLCLLPACLALFGRRRPARAPRKRDA
ncbi:MAG: efflux RND transporter permease subunit [Planctomycetota bacterium]|jgi:hydrophobe/amphiphile efflux-3 (HAE3) family protein